MKTKRKCHENSPFNAIFKHKGQKRKEKRKKKRFSLNQKKV